MRSLKWFSPLIKLLVITRRDGKLYGFRTTNSIMQSRVHNLLQLETEMTSSSQHHHQQQKDSQFLFSLKFQNSLPNAPSGPFFKKVPFNSITHQPLQGYRVSTLEKSYIWQPNFGQDLGINLDLVDKEAVLVPENSNKVELEAYLTENNEKVRGKNLPITQDDKPFWLRSTTYMSNDVFRPVLKSRDDDIKVKSSKLLASEGDLEDTTSISYIEDTFKSVDETVSNLKKQEKRKLLFSIPLLPLEASTIRKRTFSIVQFDEDVGIVKQENNSNEPKKRSNIIESSIITNVRLGKNLVGASSLLESSLVSANIANAPSSSTSSDEGNSNHSEVVYGWVKDYEMKLQSHHMEDSFLFFLNENEPSVVSYMPFSARIEMKKLGMDDSTPHECLVTRTDIND